MYNTKKVVKNILGDKKSKNMAWMPMKSLNFQSSTREKYHGKQGKVGFEFADDESPKRYYVRYDSPTNEDRWTLLETGVYETEDDKRAIRQKWQNYRR